MTQVLSDSIDECEGGSNDSFSTTNTSLTYDIGYPLHFGAELTQSSEDAHICCRGDRSCSKTNTIQTDLGNIVCIAHEACADSNLVWTTATSNSDSVDKNNNNNNDANSSLSIYESNIFCAATSACIDSVLDSANNIVCAAIEACQYSIVLSARKLYCITGDSCSGMITRNVDQIYIIEQQTDMVIYSGNRGNTLEVVFKAPNSGSGTTIYCESHDVCNIECNYQSCTNETLLYCYGKCFIDCVNTTTNNNNTCSPQIITSLAPTAAPTAAPTSAPTVPPTNAPTSVPTAFPTSSPSVPPTDSPTPNPTASPTTSPTAVPSLNPTLTPTVPPTPLPSSTPSIPPTSAPSMMPSGVPTLEPTDAPNSQSVLLVTEEEAAMTLNVLLLSMLIAAVSAIIIGFAKARCFRQKNELFNWKIILIAAFYASDFFSDVFFCIRLAIISFENGIDTKSEYFILFIIALMFIIVPFFANVIPLHFEISKWTQDIVLKDTQVPSWVKRNTKFLYFLSVITGSSFTAISLCNSYLFRWSIFSMGLPQYHRSIFQTKRFFSVVLLEV